MMRGEFITDNVIGKMKGLADLRSRVSSHGMIIIRSIKLKPSKLRGLGEL